MNGKKYWTYDVVDEEKIAFFSENLNIKPITGKILLNRGIDDLKKANIFLNPDINQLHDPFLLKDMDKAVQRIQTAINNGESIWIYGDYDVDGVSSTSIMVKYFQSIEYPVSYYIPDRMEEGYGINKEAIEKICREGGNLIITVDCGITSVEEVKYASELGLDMIITDHHECHGKLPEAYAVVNPKREDCQYPFDMICGCGVALKLIQAMTPPEIFNESIYHYIDIVAIATVADVVPLIDENRVFVKNGLEYMLDTCNVGIQALLEVCGLKQKKLNAGHIGFVLGPRINAAGRIGTADIAVKLLTSTDYSQAKELALFLDTENRNRQQIEIEIYNEVIRMIEGDSRYQKQKVLVLYGEGWHHGVIGIVASRIVEKYYKPTVILAIEGQEAKGSARSIPGFNIFEAMNCCREIFTKFGGHEQAAGLSLKTEDIEIFREKINSIADKMLTDEDFIPNINCDGILEPREIDDLLIRELEILEPYGLGNPSPKFIYRNANPVEVRAVGSEGKHLKMKIEGEGKTTDTIGFNLGEYADLIRPEDKVDIVFTPEYNNFNGVTKIQFNLKDLKVTTGDDMFAHPVVNRYYETLELDQKNIGTEGITSELPTVIIGRDKDEALLEHFKKLQKPILVLANTLQQALRLLSLVEIREKGNNIRIKHFFNKPSHLHDENEIHIVINPNIDKIMYKSYNNIILYDLFFSEAYFSEFLKLVNPYNTIILYEEGDERSNERVLQSVIPERNFLVMLYRFLLSQTGDCIKLYYDDFYQGMIQQFNFKINKALLNNALVVFDEGKLIKYNIADDYYGIKLLKTSKKINIESLSSYQNNIKKYKDFISFKDKILQLYMRRK